MHVIGASMTCNFTTGAGLALKLQLSYLPPNAGGRNFFKEKKIPKNSSGAFGGRPSGGFYGALWR